MTELCLVSARAGNLFMRELLAAVGYEAAELGATVTEAWDEFPPLGHDGAYLIVPHEYAASAASVPTPAELSRTIALCVEQPGGPWWELSLGVAARCAAAIDISRVAMLEYPRRGIRAEHFAVGHTRAWDRWSGRASATRSIDIVSLGSRTVRREQVLAQQADAIWPWRSRLLMPDERPKTEPAADFLTGEAKLELLSSSRALLNVHRSDNTYFEWVRIAEAMCNGCVIVSEHSLDVDPLVPGEHFLSGAAPNLGSLTATLLEDETERSAMAQRAHDLLRDELPMRRSVERLLGIVQTLGPQRRRSSLPAPNGRSGPAPASAPAAGAADGRSTRAMLKELALAQIVTHRSLDDLRARAADLDPELVSEIYRTPAFDRVDPEVTVCIPLHDHGPEVLGALQALLVSEDCDWDALVLDDGSQDDSVEVVRAYLTERDWLPVRLLSRPANRGLGRTRNDLLSAARAPLAFIHDADNSVYPPALSRLCEALESDGGATFAYPILKAHCNGEAVGLRSTAPWEPARFREGNFIDAMSMVRIDRILALGGYTEDVRLYGWEDFELWCRVAASGGHGVHLPEILCRYRAGTESMLSITNIDSSAALALLRERYPRLFSGVGPTTRSSR